MSNAEFDQQIALFRSQINHKRFDDETIRILELVLVSKDVKSSIEMRESLIEFLRSESVSVIREIAEKTVEMQLLILEFFVRAFALVGDIESCLALRYEALVLRDLKSSSRIWLQVSHMEWLNFAEQSLENGFYAIAGKACESAESFLQQKNVANSKAEEIYKDLQVLEKIKILKDFAAKMAGSRSVQAQAAEYLKKKTTEKGKIRSSYHKKVKCPASTLFRNGIKRRNLRKLRELQGFQQITSGS
ncbi:F10K1.23 [Melia azedarach]|uniref:F10K1.23 n=1 Tax=Melia azedarach TaxID=155640 RepID=A0ACC1YP89_MELAZ|nr:F10K1.23 [Melia azedarach]